MATNDAWLSGTIEATLDPKLPICDAHHHLWNFRADGVEECYLLDDFLRDTSSGHNIVSTVFIECGAMFKANGPTSMRPIGETEFANGMAAMSASGHYGNTRVAAAIVGTVDLTLGDAVPIVLEAQIAAGGGRFRGIRHGATWHEDSRIPNHRTDPPPGLLMNKAFRSGFAHLATFGLTFEAWCYHTQLHEVIHLARQFPETLIVLDHLGGPLGVGPYSDQATAVFLEWDRAMTELAACDNVVTKLGGLAMEVNGFNWHRLPAPPTSDDLLKGCAHYYERTIELFGVDRCLFESNFPVDKISCSYNTLWNAFKKLTRDYSASDKAKLFHDNAQRIYRIA